MLRIDWQQVGEGVIAALIAAGVIAMLKKVR